MSNTRLCPQCGHRQLYDPEATTSQNCGQCHYIWKKRKTPLAGETRIPGAGEPKLPGMVGSSKKKKKKKPNPEAELKKQEQLEQERRQIQKFFTGTVVAGVLVLFLVIIPLIGFMMRVSATRALYATLKDPQKAQQARPEWLSRGEAAVPLLLKGLRDTSVPDVEVLKILGALKEKGGTAVDPVAALLDSPNNQIQAEAAKTLGQIGPSAIKHVPTLIQKLDKADSTTRVAILEAVKSLGDPSDAIPVLKRILVPDPKAIHGPVIEMVGQFGSVAKPLVPELLVILNQDNGGDAIAVCGALGQIAPDSEQALAALKLQIENTSKSVPVRQAAVSALSKFGPPAIPILNSCVDQSALIVKAAIALGETGDKAAILPLQRALVLTNQFEQEQASSAIRGSMFSTRTTITNRNSRGEVLSQRGYSTGSNSEGLQNQLQAVRKGWEEHRETIRESLRKLGAEVPE